MKGFSYLPDVATLELDREACVGCGMCEEVCPHQVFALRGDKAEIVDADRCMECGACRTNCPAGAIRGRRRRRLRRRADQRVAERNPPGTARQRGLLLTPGWPGADRLAALSPGSSCAGCGLVSGLFTSQMRLSPPAAVTFS